MMELLDAAHEGAVFKILDLQELVGAIIECYRLRLKDSCFVILKNDILDDHTRSNSRHGFELYLRKLESRPELLPPEWCPAKRVECERTAGTHSWMNHAIQEDEMVEDTSYHYTRAMALRIMGGIIFDNVPITKREPEKRTGTDSESESESDTDTEKVTGTVTEMDMDMN